MQGKFWDENMAFTKLRGLGKRIRRNARRLRQKLANRIAQKGRIRQMQTGFKDKVNPKNYAFQETKEWKYVDSGQYTRLAKAFERNNIGEREKRRIQAAAALRVPPTYAEMRKRFGL